MKRGDMSDLVGGGLLLALGLFVVSYVGANYALGSMRRMGPGMFPLLLGALLILLGATIAVASFFRTTAVPFFDIRPFVAVTGSMLAFGLVVPTFGLVPAVVALTLISSFADHGPKLLMSLALSAVLSLLVVLIFPVGLGVRVPLFNWPFG